MVDKSTFVKLLRISSPTKPKGALETSVTVKPPVRPLLQFDPLLRGNFRIGLCTATVESPKLTVRLGATQSGDGGVDTTPVSLHRLVAAAWTQPQCH